MCSRLMSGPLNKISLCHKLNSNTILSIINKDYIKDMLTNDWDSEQPLFALLV